MNEEGNEQSMTESDPYYHLLSSRQHRDGEMGSDPATFAERAEMYRESLAIESRRYVSVTGLDALLGAALLKEFAARMRHDIARDTVDSDAEELAQIASEVADRLNNATGSL
jgi:hypothetical protein